MLELAANAVFLIAANACAYVRSDRAVLPFSGKANLHDH